MPIAAIYVRKSKFTGKGESIQNQIEMCKKYAKEKYLEVNDNYIYIDEGFSGGHIDRPKFQKMLRDAEKEIFNTLICYRLDRISRSITDFSSTIELLENHNISFISLREHFDTSTPMGRAMMYIASVFAQLERETIAERIRDNMLQLARTGRWLGGITPTGFESKPISYIDSDLKERQMYSLSPIEDELDIIKMLFDKYLKLNSLSKLEEFCLKNKIKTKNDNDFNKSSLNLILKNPVYAIADKDLFKYFKNNNMDIANDESEFNGDKGVLVYNKNIESKGKSNRFRDKKEWIVAISNHKGIISSKKWILVQNMLYKNSNKSPRMGTSKSGLLSGLIRCGNCNSPMRVKHGHTNPKTGKKHYYYVCTLKENSRGKRCRNSNLKGNLIDALLLDRIKKELLDLNSIASQLDLHKDKVYDNGQSRLNNIDKFQNLIKENESKIQALIKEIYNNKNSRASKYIINEIERLDESNIKLKEKITKLKSNTKAAINLDFVKDSNIDFDILFNIISIDSKHELLSSIIESIHWRDGNLKIKFKDSLNDMNLSL